GAPNELMSRPVRGAWIETLPFLSRAASFSCRAPYGARGLKPPWCAASPGMQASRPVRGAWIETRVARRNDGPIRGRAPYGARGLKLFRYPEVLLGSSGRAPYGARG